MIVGGRRVSASGPSRACLRPVRGGVHGAEGAWLGSLDAAPGRARAPKPFNPRSDPFERAEEGAGDYDKWFIEHLFVLVPAQAIVAQHIQSFQSSRRGRKPGSFSVDEAMQMLMNRKGDN